MRAVHDWTPGNKLIHLAIALVWLYQGFWCKVRQHAVPV